MNKTKQHKVNNKKRKNEEKIKKVKRYENTNRKTKQKQDIVDLFVTLGGK